MPRSFFILFFSLFFDIVTTHIFTHFSFFQPMAVSSRHKGKSVLRPKPPFTTRMTPQYFIIDTVLPSHVVNDRSLFTTYVPSNRVHQMAFGTEIMIEGIGNVEVHVSAGGKFITFTIHNCWHVPFSPHHFLSSLSVTSPSCGHHVMLAGHTPRLLFLQKHRIADPIYQSMFHSHRRGDILSSSLMFLLRFPLGFLPSIT